MIWEAGTTGTTGVVLTAKSIGGSTPLGNDPVTGALVTGSSISRGGHRQREYDDHPLPDGNYHVTNSPGGGSDASAIWVSEAAVVRST